MVRLAAGRHASIRREPAQEIRGHRQRPFLRRRLARALASSCATSCCSGSTQGVKIFRVDNPHTKPFPFWEWMIREVNGALSRRDLPRRGLHPAEDDEAARQGRLHQQCYTYFTWRNTKQELTEYLTELTQARAERVLSGRTSSPTRPTSTRITSRPAAGRASSSRATLAATLSASTASITASSSARPRPIPGKEEYLNSEKYEIKAWDYDRPGNIREHIRRLNRIRRENPALWDFRNVHFLNAFNDNILAYAKLTPEGDNCVLVARQPRSAATVRNAPTRCRSGSSASRTTRAIEAEDLLRAAVQVARQIAPHRPRPGGAPRRDLAP